jgi:hypothetical protein
MMMMMMMARIVRIVMTVTAASASVPHDVFSKQCETLGKKSLVGGVFLTGKGRGLWMIT